MQSFRSQNLGVRRLAVVLAIIAGAGATWTQIKPFRAIQQRGWDNAYFREEVAKHPELTLTSDRDGWYLQDETLEKKWKAEHLANPYYFEWDWRWSIIEQFRRTADAPPKISEYLALAITPISAAVIAWLLVHTIAWVTTGFRTGTVH